MPQYSRDYVYPSKMNLVKKKGKFWKRVYHKIFRQKTKPENKKK